VPATVVGVGVPAAAVVGVTVRRMVEAGLDAPGGAVGAADVNRRTRSAAVTVSLAAMAWLVVVVAVDVDVDDDAAGDVLAGVGVLGDVAGRVVVGTGCPRMGLRCTSLAISSARRSSVAARLPAAASARRAT
jgi:hypothetical protein